MLGQPMFLPTPLVVGVRVRGALRRGTTATDLVSTLTQMLREHGVVGRFVEFFGDGCSTLELADRATLSNMGPEYGATSAYWPVDEETLRYLELTGRGDRVTSSSATRTSRGCSVATATPSRSSPRSSSSTSPRSSRRSPARSGRKIGSRFHGCGVRSSKRSATGSSPTPTRPTSGGSSRRAGNRRSGSIPDETVEPGTEEPVPLNHGVVRHGSVVIAAITSCTNTSNPAVMLAAGLLAKKAVEAGLDTKPWVKTSLARGRAW